MFSVAIDYVFQQSEIRTDGSRGTLNSEPRVQNWDSLALLCTEIVLSDKTGALELNVVLRLRDVVRPYHSWPWP
jgi:hypothetical protein